MVTVAKLPSELPRSCAWGVPQREITDAVVELVVEVPLEFLRVCSLAVEIFFWQEKARDRNSSPAMEMKNIFMLEIVKRLRIKFPSGDWRCDGSWKEAGCGPARH